MKSLRPYQSDCVGVIFDAHLEGYRRILYSLPTGTGKTVVFAEIVRLCLYYNFGHILVMAHRDELITQAYKTIAAHCHLSDQQIGIEQGSCYADPSNKVVVGTVQTIQNEKRLANWKPDVIICDEAHRMAASSYQKIAARLGVPDTCLLIGCTATPHRSDKQTLCAFGTDGQAVMVEEKDKTKREATLIDATFDLLCYEMPLDVAIDDGWLVPIKGITVKTTTDLSKIKTRRNMDGEEDFAVQELQKVLEVDNKRANEIVSGWLQHANGRSTIVFCEGVDHAKLMNATFIAAGVASEVVVGTTDVVDRVHAIQRFKSGELPILCGADVFIEGFDADVCNCVLMAKPTKALGRYKQMAGRGTRPLAGTVDGPSLDTPAARIRSILSSAKPDTLIVDVRDMIGKHNICSTGSLLGIPAKIDLEGKSVSEAKAKLEKLKDEVDMPIITTFSEVETLAERVDVIRRSSARSASSWSVTVKGFKYQKLPPNYYGEVREVYSKTGERMGKYKARLTFNGQPIHSAEFEAKEIGQAIDAITKDFAKTAEEHRKEKAATTPRGTWKRLTPKQQNVLSANGHYGVNVDCWTLYKAKAMIDKYMTAWKDRQSVG